jgi:asparagine synthase (glutamine-hydrolysing)
MCGVVGIISVVGKEVNLGVLQNMTNTLYHRGPDGGGIWISDDKTVGFGHRRLSIIDLSSNGLQPMSTLDNRFTITYNGEVYNYLELRKECEKLGSRFFSTSDTEVVLECFRHWREKAFAKFSGMWALAIYDRFTNTVTFSRDPFGIKPLYYGFYRGDFYFASEPKAFRAVSSEFSDIDEVTVELFIEDAYLDRGDWTFYKNIKRFPHAHYGVFYLHRSDSPLKFTRDWHPPVKQNKMSMKEASLELRRLLSNSIHLHLRSDVPVGACLSGGIDSSAIVCIGNKYLAPDQVFNTFTTFYSGYSQYNESQWAKKAIEFARTNAIFVEPTYENFISRFNDLLKIQDEPYGSLSIFAQYTVFDRISQSNVKVVLDGQGSDEQFAGYVGLIDQFLASLYKESKLLTYVKEGILLKGRYNYQFKPNIKFIMQKLIQNQKNKKSEFSNEFLFTKKVDSTFLDTYEERKKQILSPYSCFEETLIGLLCEANIPQLLRYEDRNSMGHSIESRVPFLEKELVSFCLSLPSTLKINNGYTKSVLREALKGLIPEEIRLRTDKLGFPVPEQEWIKRAFGITVNSTGSKEWRKIITSKWIDFLQNSADSGQGRPCLNFS